MLIFVGGCMATIKVDPVSVRVGQSVKVEGGAQVTILDKPVLSTRHSVKCWVCSVLHELAGRVRRIELVMPA